MAIEPRQKQKKKNSLRFAEYYDMTEVFDELYTRSKGGEIFTDLMKVITTEENIMLAYRNFKRNNGSYTPGSDNLTIRDIEKCSKEEVVRKVRNKLKWYCPKPVRRVEIPKADGKKRPLGIPTIWDRMVQQAILQVLDPICEAKFFDRSNGFRPNRSAENAIAQCMKLIQMQHMYFVVDVDIKGFFDNVNHTKLIRQIWTLGIRDKKLICVIKAMLKAPIVMPDGTMVYPEKGTPQGGILSPLLANIVLNELDWWVHSQWEGMPTKHYYPGYKHENGSESRAHVYRALRGTKLKEMYIVRYADDFKIFCRTRGDANKIFRAVEQWLKTRLKLDISPDKSKIVNLKKNYSEFLGFKLKAVKRGEKYIVRSHMTDKAINREIDALKAQIKKIEFPKSHEFETKEIMQYNSMVMGIHQYYGIATRISDDCSRINWSIRKSMENRLGIRLKKKPKGRPLLLYGINAVRYASSKQIRYVSDCAIYPIGFPPHHQALHLRKGVNCYTVEGRKKIHKDLSMSLQILHRLMRNPVLNRSIEYADNRISLYVAQNGKCAVTKQRLEYDDIHCHHIIPLEQGGTDEYKNLVIVHRNVHLLIHATDETLIDELKTLLKLDQKQIDKVNKYRLKAGRAKI